MFSNRTVTVFGAYGHTGRFVVSQLRKRGWTPILSGRDADKLNATAAEHPGSEVRVASVDNPQSLDCAISGASAIINCAGPFLDTAVPIVEAAIRSGIHYLDVAAEQAAVLEVFERFADVARVAGVVIAPAMAFYGGLGDLMATTAMGEWDCADEICIAVALDSWKPTRGTRLTGQRNTGRRFIFRTTSWSALIRRRDAGGLFRHRSDNKMSWLSLWRRPSPSHITSERLRFVCS